MTIPPNLTQVIFRSGRLYDTSSCIRMSGATKRVISTHAHWHDVRQIDITSRLAPLTDNFRGACRTAFAIPTQKRSDWNIYEAVRLGYIRCYSEYAHALLVYAFCDYRGIPNLPLVSLMGSVVSIFTRGVLRLCRHT